MKARAPGKVVMSGAYAVLEGSPCIVSAVDRYVIADSSRAPEHIADEVRAAMPPPFPHIDASALRHDGRKLGLGSSAAIVVASLATLPEHPCATARDLESLYERALFAHRNAQGGGSGVDVAAATFGGTLVCHYDAQGPGRASQVTLPRLRFQVWSCPEAAVTRGFLARVREFKRLAPSQHAALFARLDHAAKAVVHSCETSDADAFLSALGEQARDLHELGTQAEIAVFTPEVAELWRLAATEGAIVMPAGAGGGDLALFCGRHPPSATLLERAAGMGVAPLPLTLGASGVERLS